MSQMSAARAAEITRYTELRAAYEQRWRAEHPEQVWRGVTVECSLCHRPLLAERLEEAGALREEHERQAHPQWWSLNLAAPELGEAIEALHFGHRHQPAPCAHLDCAETVTCEEEALCVSCSLDRCPHAVSL